MEKHTNICIPDIIYEILTTHEPQIILPRIMDLTFDSRNLMKHKYVKFLNLILIYRYSIRGSEISSAVNDINLRCQRHR